MVKAKKKISSLGTAGAFLSGRACSDTLFHVLSHAFDHPMTLEERAAMPLAGGILQRGFQCGMIWGAAIVAGAEAYRLFGPGLQAEARAIAAAKRLFESFRAQNNAVNCIDITGVDNTSTDMQMISYFLLRGGTIGCIRMATRYAPVAFHEINAAFSDKHSATSTAPASCSAMLARKMGASDIHVAMASGLAGGIGLCGGACGALGTAVWIAGMRAFNERGSKIDFRDPEAENLIDRFTECTGSAFECSKIAGRMFESVDEHADYLRDGGCSKIIETLAAE